MRATVMAREEARRREKDRMQLSKAALLHLTVLTAIWYWTSAENGVASQQFVKGVLLSEMPFVTTDHHLCVVMMVVTVLQLGMGALMGSVVMLLSRALLLLRGDRICCRVKAVIPPKQTAQHLILGLLHFLGSLCTNLGFLYGSVSLVQLLKLIEPLETLIIGLAARTFIWRREMAAASTATSDFSLTRKQACAMLLVVGGTMAAVASTPGGSTPIPAVVFATMSGIIMSSRNVLKKHIQQKDKIENPPSAQVRDQNLVQQTTNFTILSFRGSAVGTILLLFVSMKNPFAAAQWISLLDQTTSSFRLLFFHASYNMASLILLGFVSAPTHSLLNVGKRVCNVVVAMVTFKETISPTVVWGLFSAFVGGLWYTVEKAPRQGEQESLAMKSFYLFNLRLVSFWFMIALLAIISMTQLWVALSMAPSRSMEQDFPFMTIIPAMGAASRIFGLNQTVGGDLALFDKLIKKKWPGASLNPSLFALSSIYPRQVCKDGKETSKWFRECGAHGIIWQGGNPESANDIKDFPYHFFRAVNKREAPLILNEINTLQNQILGMCEVKFRDRKMKACHLVAWGGNFGDELGPAVIKRIVETKFQCSAEQLPVEDLWTFVASKGERPADLVCLFSVGSIWSYASAGDHMWGAGNKFSRLDECPRNITVYSTRGLRTMEAVELQCTDRSPNAATGDHSFDSVGDPGFLVPYLFPQYEYKQNDAILDYCVIPHKYDTRRSDIRAVPKKYIIFAKQHWEPVLRQMIKCRYVISSSLHGIILANSMGIPVQWLSYSGNQGNSEGKSEPPHKYLDYFETIQAGNVRPAGSIQEALEKRAENEERVLSKPVRDEYAQSILNSFPLHLFETVHTTKQIP